ncbi:GNAT family N-acetyltransferase [Nocardia jinanensis]|uniref:GNAT family N-acetyltransferase n=1 Tax=Nocardia jinanensis TaxID=382504 RepID=UPI0007A4EE80|nr:GNAT family N-acetyltransferase [Nocardia jinanensis]
MPNTDDRREPGPIASAGGLIRRVAGPDRTVSRVPGDHPPTVRTAVSADIDHIVAVRHQVAEEGRWIGAEVPFDTAEAARRTRTAIEDAEYGVFVAEMDNAIVGTATVDFTSRGVTSFGMMLLGSYRGRGIGTLLLDRVIGWSRAHGAHKVSLQVWPHNEPALALYTRAGFEIEGILRAHYRRRNGELWDAVMMGLPLSRPAGAHE